MRARSLAPAVLAALALCVSPGPARAQGLGIGDPAPKLQVKEFVKGQPVTAFQKGKNYVVEFWATWCGPCRTSIPHLTELQKKYPAVTFVGVSVWEQDQAKVKPYVAEMGEKMGYRVALDSIAPGGDGDSGKMAQTWMKAAGQDGIPTAFLVNGEGRVAWIGHPMSMEEPLGKLVAGTLDVNAAAVEFKKDRERKSKLAGLNAKLSEAQKTGGLPAVLTAIDETLANDSSLETAIGFTKFRLMQATKADPEKVVAYGQRLVRTVFKDEGQLLNALSWSLVQPGTPKPESALAALAVEAAERSDELAKHKDAAITDTLARAYFVSGKARKALETQERAIALAKGTPLEQEKELTDRLEEYRKAAAKE